MLKPNEPTDDDFDPVAPECRATVEAIQRALDGAAESLEVDAHAITCRTCRERVRAARVLLSVLAIPREPVPVPSGFADRVVRTLATEGRSERRSLRRTVIEVVWWSPVAAVVLAGVFAIAPPRPAPNGGGTFTFVGPSIAPKTPEVAPAPREKVPAPEPRPMRLGDEVAKAGQAFRDTPKPLADSVAVAPKLYDAFASAFRRPAEPAPPMNDMLEPARKSLAELPDAARHGLEPVTGTAQKAFDRLLRDVAFVKPKS